MLSGPKATGGSITFTVIEDPQQILDYIHAQNLPPATTQLREAQAKREEIVVWKVTQFPGFTGQEGENFTIDNGFDVHSYRVKSGGQEFGIFAQKTTDAFQFAAGANPTSGKMTGTWTTRAGTVGYNLETGDTMVVRVR